MIGRLITLEGIDGSGKSTQVQLLVEALRRASHDVVTWRDPGGTAISEQIREILLATRNAGMDAVTELLLYEAARAQMVAENVRPAMDKGRIVVLDRFYDSTTAYQGFGRGIDRTIITQANAAAAGGLLPDRTYFIDVTWEEAQRRRSRGQADRLETEDHLFFQRIRNGYIQIAQDQPKRFRIVDGSQPEPEVARTILADVMQLLRA